MTLVKEEKTMQRMEGYAKHELIGGRERRPRERGERREEGNVGI